MNFDVVEGQALAVADRRVREDAARRPVVAEHRSDDLILHRVVGRDRVDHSLRGHDRHVVSGDDLHQPGVVVRMRVRQQHGVQRLPEAVERATASLWQPRPSAARRRRPRLSRFRRDRRSRTRPRALAGNRWIVGSPDMASPFACFMRPFPSRSSVRRRRPGLRATLHRTASSPPAGDRGSPRRARPRPRATRGRTRSASTGDLPHGRAV